MIRGLAENISSSNGYPVPPHGPPGATDSTVVDFGIVASGGACADTVSTIRRTPRVSLVVVLPENHTVTPDSLLEGLHASGDREQIDVLVACAGQPANLSALQRCVGDAQFLLAPAGTSSEDLRELAMSHAVGDIVTLVSGAVLHAGESGERPHFRTR